MSKGYLLVEVSVAYLILALAIAALVPTFILAIKATKNTEKIQVATELSAEMLEEIRLRRWDENTPIPAEYTSAPSPTLGPDSGETATDKTYFDDIDDFNGWSETGARDPLNRALSNFSKYDRTVLVQYASSTMSVLGSGTSDYKKVTACTRTSNLNPVCLYTVVTNR